MKPQTSDKVLLIVDDSEFDRNLLTKALSKKQGYRILQADTGEKCLEMLETETVDLILMDIMMPGTLGTEVLRRIRERHNQIELPIIMTTARIDAMDVVGSLHLGANDYIKKPINFDVAVTRIQTHLKMADMTRQMIRLQEIAAMNAMIGAYNHEINNALMVAMGYLKKVAPEGEGGSVALKKTEEAMQRIASFVRKIREAHVDDPLEYDSYPGAKKILKVE